MIIALLQVVDRTRAAEHLEAHQAWLSEGVASGHVLLVGNLSEGRGGALLLHGLDSAEARSMLDTDPFVAHGVVDLEIHEISPHTTDPRLAFLAA